jgi:simple sugar transport system permease protein
MAGAAWLPLRLERRAAPEWRLQLAALLLALLASGIMLVVLFLAAGADPWQAFAALAKGAFGTRRAALETLVKATPLILTGLAFAIGYHARLWNIGAEGQLFAGAIMAYWAATLLLGLPLPRPILLLALGLAAALGGALLAGLAGLLRARYGVSEIIATVMLNYLVVYLLSYLLTGGPWGEPGSVYQQTARLDQAAWLPVLAAPSRLHAGFVVALLAALAAYALLWRTPLGLEIRAMGRNPEAARLKGIRLGRTIVIALAISGALAGLAGLAEVFGVHHRLRADVSPGYGFTGIIIAMLGSNHPAGIVLAAVLFGALVNGALQMQITTGVPSALSYVLQALILLSFLVASVAVRWRPVWRPAP